MPRLTDHCILRRTVSIFRSVFPHQVYIDPFGTPQPDSCRT
jgi:hypothetical protein